LVISKNYNEMHGQQNIKFFLPNVSFFQAARGHISEHGGVRSHRCDSLRSHQKVCSAVIFDGLCHCKGLFDRILPSAASSGDATSLHVICRRFRAACIRRLTDDLSVFGQRPFQRKIRDFDIQSVGFYDHVDIQRSSNHSKRWVGGGQRERDSFI
jgi:hypothetical protein